MIDCYVVMGLCYSMAYNWCPCWSHGGCVDQTTRGSGTGSLVGLLIYEVGDKPHRPSLGRYQ